MFPALLRLGLSATPDRADGKELLIHAHIGPIRAKTEAQLMVPKVLRFRSDWQCPRVLRPDQETGEQRGRAPAAPARQDDAYREDARRRPVRNHMIARADRAGATRRAARLVVFSTLHDHLKAIHRACIEGAGISGRKIGFYVGATTKAEKEQREREKVKPILFTTYAMMCEGTSLDWLDTCILAMPRSNVDAAGRAHPPRVPRQGAAGRDGRCRRRQPGVPGLRGQSAQVVQVDRLCESKI